MKKIALLSIFWLIMISLGASNFYPIVLQVKTTDRQKSDSKIKRQLFDNLSKQMQENKIILFGTYGIAYQESQQFMNYKEINEEIVAKFPLKIDYNASDQSYLAKYDISETAISDQMKRLSKIHYDKALTHYQNYLNSQNHSFSSDFSLIKSLDELIQCNHLEEEQLLQSKKILLDLDKFFAGIILIPPSTSYNTGMGSATFKAVYSSEKRPISALSVNLMADDKVFKFSTDNYGFLDLKNEILPNRQYKFQVDFSSFIDNSACYNDLFIKHLFAARVANTYGEFSKNIVSKLKMSFRIEDFQESEVASVISKLLKRGYQREKNPDNADLYCLIGLQISEYRQLSNGAFYLKGNLYLEITDKNGSVKERIRGAEYKMFSNQSEIDLKNKVKKKITGNLNEFLSKI
jgi:hypothetical protein